jgi:ribosomal protein S7
MALMDQIKKNWAAWLVIGGIAGGTFYVIDMIDARAEEVARKTVQAEVNKAMIDGAKEAAKQAVKDELPKISKQVAKDVVQELKDEQMVKAAPTK